jgi:LPPG:FO 2-phospho-L-lactate transferase
LTDIEIIALTGGIGGCKLALGLQHIVRPERLACIVNTGDDFRHLGLHISPDLDTALYTLAGLNDPVQGWGRRDETWTFMRVLEELGAPTWFRLGDGDLGLHVERTRRLAAGESLTAVMDDVRQRFGVPRGCCQ